MLACGTASLYLNSGSGASRLIVTVFALALPLTPPLSVQVAGAALVAPATMSASSAQAMNVFRTRLMCRLLGPRFRQPPTAQGRILRAHAGSAQQGLANGRETSLGDLSLGPGLLQREERNSV